MHGFGCTGRTTQRLQPDLHCAYTLGAILPNYCPGLWTKLAPMGLGFRGLGFRVGGSGFGLRFGLNPNPNRTAEASVKQNVQLDAAP